MKIHRYIAVLWMIFFVTLPVIASEEVPAEEHATPSVFEGYYGEAIWTLIWFFVLLIVLWKFAWKPVLAGLNSRTEHIEKQISDAEKTRKEAKKILEEYGAKLADAERQGRDIITARTKEAEKQAKEVHQQTKRELEQRKIRADAELERERTEAADELWGQAGDIVRQLGKEVFGKSLDDEDNRKLIAEAIARLKQQGQ